MAGNTLTSMASSDLKVLANDLRVEFNARRRVLFKDVQLYYRQSVASNYIKEQTLVDSAQECERIKKKYREVCDILLGRGERLPGWLDRPQDSLHAV